MSHSSEQLLFGSFFLGSRCRSRFYGIFNAIFRIFLSYLLLRRYGHLLTPGWFTPFCTSDMERPL